MRLRLRVCLNFNLQTSLDKKVMEEKEEKKTIVRLSKKQKTFLQVLESNAYNVSAACKSFGISRRAYYDWYEGNPKFRQEVDAQKESLIDFAESKLHMNIKEGKEASIFFFLKTQAKKRGYIETVENQVMINPFEELMKAASANDKE